MKFASGILLVAGLAVASALHTGRIVGGNNAPQGSATYHAHILMRAHQGAEQTHVGSGSLVSQQHIITSATNVRK